MCNTVSRAPCVGAVHGSKSTTKIVTPYMIAHGLTLFNVSAVTFFNHAGVMSYTGKKSTRALTSLGQRGGGK